MIIDAMQTPIRPDANENWNILRDYQQHSVTAIRVAYSQKKRCVLFFMATGGGKCLAHGTPVVMFDGTIKPVEDVQIGDLLMGPDSKPRAVTSLARGREAMYRIVPVKGDPYTVNESHILSLRNHHGAVYNADVQQFLRERKKLESKGFMGWRVPGVLSGDTKACLVGIKAVEPLGEGDYYGFSLDGPDRLFLLGDFTVTHNTLTSSYIVDQAQLKGKRVLILVHRTKLMKQFSEALTKYGVRHGLIAPGAPFDVTKNVQVAKVGTMVRRMHKLPWRPDFIIVDEAHHCVVGTQFGQIIERYAHAPSLLLSATPWRLNGDGLGRGHGGYADALVLGPDASFLIERENLSPYKIYGTSEPVDMSGAKTRGGDWATSEMEARIDKPMIIGNAVAHYTKLAKGKRAIVFTPSIRLAEKFSDDFCAAGYKFRAVHGEMKEEEQDAIVDMLDRHEIDGIVTVDLVSEGFDLPAIECAIFLRPTASLSLWLQMVGRVLRPSPGKEYAIVLDHVGNSARHGLPDDPREWTLEGRPKKQGKPKEKPEDPVKQCDRCGAVHRPASKCPECGYVYEVQSRTVEEVDGELKEIEAAKVRQERRMLIGQCRTYEDFVQVGQQLGYKPGWARVQFDIRQQREQERRQAALQNRLKYCRTFEHFERLAQDFGLAPEWAQYQFDQYSKIAAQEPHQVQSV